MAVRDRSPCTGGRSAEIGERADIAEGAPETGLQDDADVVEPAAAQLPVDLQRLRRVRRLLHVDANEVAALRGVLHDGLGVLEAEVAVDRQSERGELDADVGVEPVPLDRIQDAVVLVDEGARLLGLVDVLPEDVDRGHLPRRVQLGHDTARVLERRPGDVTVRDLADDRLRNRRQQPDDGAIDDVRHLALAHESLAGSAETSATASGKRIRIASRSANACSSAVPETSMRFSAAPVSSTAVFSVSVANCSRCASATDSACWAANSRSPRMRSSGSCPNNGKPPSTPSSLRAGGAPAWHRVPGRRVLDQRLDRPAGRRRSSTGLAGCRAGPVDVRDQLSVRRPAERGTRVEDLGD